MNFYLPKSKPPIPGLLMNLETRRRFLELLSYFHFISFFVFKRGFLFFQIETANSVSFNESRGTKTIFRIVALFLFTSFLFLKETLVFPNRDRQFQVFNEFWGTRTIFGLRIGQGARKTRISGRTDWYMTSNRNIRAVPVNMFLVNMWNMRKCVKNVDNAARTFWGSFEVSPMSNLVRDVFFNDRMRAVPRERYDLMIEFLYIFEYFLQPNGFRFFSDVWW